MRLLSRRFLGIRPLVWAIVSVLAFTSYRVWYYVLTHEPERPPIQQTMQGRA